MTALPGGYLGFPMPIPYPIHADLKDVRNSQGLPLAVEMNGTPVVKHVIDKAEQDLRNTRMKAVCTSCHSSEWSEEHFRRLDNTIARTNDITHEATKIIMDIWERGYARGLPQGANIFDEEAERMWTSIWLFYANSTRFASAMAGGGDYGVFADGRYQTTEQLYRLNDYLKLHESLEIKCRRNKSNGEWQGGRYTTARFKTVLVAALRNSKRMAGRESSSIQAALSDMHCNCVLFDAIVSIPKYIPIRTHWL